MSFEIDKTSLLVSVPGAATLLSIEEAVASEGLTLGIDPSAITTTPVREWIASGAPGVASSFSDPADHLIAGLTATLADGSTTLEVRPAPRRAVGPDLVALFFGAQDRFGTIDKVWLRVHLKNAKRASYKVAERDLDPPVTNEEASLLDAIERALSFSDRS
jgi:alkyldihydroxyacetonephosphate synthase